MSSNIINGTDLILSVNGVAVAGAKSHTISIKGTERDISSKDSGSWKESVMGRFQWDSKVDGLVSFDASICNFASLTALMVAKTQVSVQSINNTGGTITAGVVSPLAGAYILSGTANIVSIDMTGGDDANATFSIALSGSGTLSQTGNISATLGAGLITTTTASLIGSVASDGTTSSALSFNYGTTTSMTSTGTASPTTTISLTPITVVSALTGLTTATTYYYQVKTVTGGITRLGAMLTFRTA